MFLSCVLGARWKVSELQVVVSRAIQILMCL